MSTEKLVLAERRGPVLVLTFNRPDISSMLPRLVGHSRAMDLLQSGRMVESAEAHRIGLIDRLVESGSVLDAAIEYANDLAAHCSPQSMATIKAQMQSDADVWYADAVIGADQLMLEAFHGPDVIEGVASHLDRRPPNFPSLPVRSSHVPV